MADAKTSQLGVLEAPPAANDLFSVVDVSDTSMAVSGTNKRLPAMFLARSNGIATLIAGNGWELLLPASGVAILAGLAGQVLTEGIGIGVAGMNLYRSAPGVLRQKLEWITVEAGSALLVAADSSGRGLVHVYSATLGMMAMFAVEGPSSSRMIHGDSTYFSPTVMAGKIVCYCETTNSIYVYNGTGSPQILAVMVWT